MGARALALRERRGEGEPAEERDQAVDRGEEHAALVPDLPGDGGGLGEMRRLRLLSVGVRRRGILRMRIRVRVRVLRWIGLMRRRLVVLVIDHRVSSCSEFVTGHSQIDVCEVTAVSSVEAGSTPGAE
ncbi:hypothetical protein GCM10010218_60230 [Streptomyces mashuensis]|uniref:Uncharacterized protein n=1 Tax=Streptomyces mashuensis TaxID=33904 RepID=A0A919EG06_9ACTN|nr:hypothetical protein GCM10010218_60230 [Streptomyces mashuensis]